MSSLPVGVVDGLQAAAGHGGLDIALVDLDHRAHALQPFQVHVHGPGADGAAVRQRHARAALAEALNCAADWIGIADQAAGFDWREI